MKRSFLWALVIVLFVGVGYAQAQSKVTGKVTDELTGESIPFTSVVVKGTTVGVNADAEGNYSITLPANAAILVFSEVAHQSLEVEIGGRSVINVALKSSTELDAAIVTGYGGIVKKGGYTGSVSAVKAKALDQVPVANFSQMLQGKATGVQVTSSSGKPGSAANIVIRGVGSLNAGTGPLYVIDNVPSTAGDFAAINANDIENLVVLKDASSTAIYGSRGANGVILITTKSGRAGETKFQFRFQAGLETLSSDKVQLMNTEELLTWQKMIGGGLGGDYSKWGTGNPSRPMTDDEIKQVASEVNTNWLKEVFQLSNMKSYELVASGGDEKTKFYISAQYFDQKAIVYGTGLDRITGRINLSHQARPWLKIGTYSTVGHTKTKIVREARNALSPMMFAIETPPYAKPYNEDGSYFTDYMDLEINFLENVNNNPTENSTLRAISSNFLEFKLMDELKFTTTIGLDYRDVWSHHYQYPESKLSQILGSDGVLGYRYNGNTKIFSYDWSNVFNYSKVFNNVHRFDATLGSAVSKLTQKAVVGYVKGFPNNRVDDLNIGAVPDGVTGSTVGFALASFFGRFGYDYDNRYFIDGSIRRDGSSRFGPDNRWGTFWSIGLAWNATNEEFMKPITWLNNLKLRGSYGVLGNYNIGNYDWRGTFSYGSYNGTNTTYPDRLSNNGLTWEESKPLSFGMEFALLNSRISGSFDWYDRRTDNLLLNAQLSRTSGFGSRRENVGSMKNTGVELVLRGDIIKTKDWLVNLEGTFSTNKNEITSLVSDEDITSSSGYGVHRVGESAYTYRLTRWAGVDALNGDALYLTKDDKITNVYGDYETVLSGKTPLPTYFGAINLSVAYKAFELSASLYYSGGNYIYSITNKYLENDGSDPAHNLSKRALYDSWKQPGDITDIPKQQLAAQSSGLSTRFLYKGDYMRLRNLMLSYKLPTDLTKKIYLDNVRIYAQAQNLFTITKYPGMDPEVGNNSETGASRIVGEVEDFNYPVSRVFTIGVDISF